MNVEREFATSPNAERVEAFRERVRKALAHDLRTPLGTIANYATILEYYDHGESEEARVFGGRIRASAMRLSAMLDELAEAWKLASAPSLPAEVDPAGLLRELLASTGIRATYLGDDAGSSARCTLDAALLGYAWRAFLRLQAESSARELLELELHVEPSVAGTCVELRSGALELRSEAAAGPPGEPLRATAFARQPSNRPTLDGGFALSLAEDLIRLHGGAFELWGRPGAAARLSIAFPRLP
ncbi:MAG: hypothetical protein IT453_20645 [Planctomycetes bacterium]|nr:hypothetical protein [Planctomycetota bacterium]